MENRESAAAQATLEHTAKAALALLSEISQRGARIDASVNQQVQSLKQEVGQFRRDVASIVDGAGARIANDARDAMSPLAVEHGRAVSAASARLKESGRIVWVWFGASSLLLGLALLAGWAVLGYYRRELAAVQDELHRYEDAVPVVQAFYASDAVLCGGRICSNEDPKGQRVGDKRQYRQAKPRP
ncbi:hypothetical protein [Pseudoxanthomonas sp. Root630]|uniref:hypothetical protein n=1 Tax=Pseudoxanthomonas sp. Root630 TaxID=1736574 RepID=UPI000AC494E7|nr:hypothetical protein [Pseudoxanthomonas sp. Root630]